MKGALSCLLLNFLHLISARDGLPKHLHIRPKHIVLCATFGGPSHIKPMLAYGSELSERGHTITLATTDDLLPYADKVGFHPYSLGPKLLSEEWENEHIYKMASSDYGDVKVLGPMLETQKMFYAPTHLALEALFQGKSSMGKVDMIVCDFFVFPCMDVANKYNVPYAISSHGVGFFGIGEVPYTTNPVYPLPSTTDKLTYLQRFKSDLLFKLKVLWNFYLPLAEIAAIRRHFGHDASLDSSNLYYDKLTLVNSFLGLETPRILPPTIQFIGPTLSPPSSRVSQLTTELQEDLDGIMERKEHAIYIGFGSQARVPKEWIQIILDGFTQALNNNVIHRVYWGMSKSAYLFPPQDKVDPRIRLLHWAPQEALLQHPAIKLFVSHCGAESVHEGLYYGKVILGLPLFAEQPGTAAKLADQGVGLLIHKMQLSPDLVASKVKELVQDKHQLFAANAKRLQALAQMAHEDGLTKAADLIEIEMEWGHQHLSPPTTKMSFIKAYSLDIYLPFLSVILYPFFLIFKFTFRKLLSKKSISTCPPSTPKYKKRQ